MKITKFGHCCLLIEENGVRILTDPGVYSDQQNKLDKIDFILITHEHSDHFHVDSVKEIIKNNPEVKIITNKTVGDLLTLEKIIFELVEDGQDFKAKGVLVEGFGKHHAPLHTTMPSMPNTGYFVANKLFYPGDAFTNPGKPVEILALPVAGPWTRLQEAIDYALEIKPQVCFPVHDGILKSIGSTDLLPPKVLEPRGVKFIVLKIDQAHEF